MMDTRRVWKKMGEREKQWERTKRKIDLYIKGKKENKDNRGSKINK
jgi:hypothetical protein